MDNLKGKTSHIPILFLILTVLVITIVAFQNVPLQYHTPASKAAGICNSTGVTRNQNGSYTFARLHINASGVLVDANNCEVFLLGGEGKNPSYGNQPEGEYHVASVADFNYVNQIKKDEPNMNVIRIPIIATAWVANAMVGNTGMTYQQFTEVYIKALEGYGLYVEADSCYQDGGGCNSHPNSTDGVALMQGLDAYFKNDPAVIYDVRNETAPGDPINEVVSENNDFLNALQTLDPAAIKVVYMDGLDQMINGTIPFYTQSNLVIDLHIYSGKTNPAGARSPGCGDPNGGTGAGSWSALISKYGSTNIPYLHVHHAGFMLNEWGGNCDWPTYSTAMTNFVTQNNIGGMNYFYPVDNWEQNSYHNINWINPIGYDTHALVSQAYTSIFASEGSTPTPTPSPTPSPSSTQTPTPSPTQTSTSTPTPTSSGTPTPTPSFTSTPTPTNNGGSGTPTVTPSSSDSQVQILDNNGNPVHGAIITYKTSAGTGTAITDSNGNADIPAGADVNGLILGTKTIPLQLNAQNGNYQVKVDPATGEVLGIKVSTNWIPMLLAAILILGIITGGSALLYISMKKRNISLAALLQRIKEHF